MKLPSLNQIIAAAAVIVAALALWTFWPREKPEVGQSSALPEVAVTPKITVLPPKVIYVYPDKVKGDLNLPPDVQKDEAKKITATGKLKAEERDYTLSAVMDTTTGQSQVFARPDPLPWIGPGRQGAVGLAYGMKNGQPTSRLYARHDLLQVKALHAGAGATLDQDGEWFAGGYVEYRF